MRSAKTIDGRFVVQQIAGGGGMGVVYRALDESTGAIVALKLLRDTADAEVVKRFAHEVKALGVLKHPHVVQYHTHGVTPAGEPYLVMEWLEGMSLADRLSRGALSIEQSIDLMRRVASALAAAHTRGIIHRDLKPTNIFLQNGQIAKAKLLDFGIARLQNATQVLTGRGTILGTPGYMAPEQARGEAVLVDARADVFSLGCVLFECVTGKPAFQGVHIMALLAKLLLEETPRLCDLRPDVPPFLDELCAAMLSKDPAKRPLDGAAVLAVLDGRDYLVSAPRAPASLTDAENRLVSVIAIAPAAGRERVSSTPDAMQFAGLSPDMLGRVRKLVTPFSAHVEELANGTLVVLLVGNGLPTDQAAAGARCALRLHDLLPRSPIVLLTGRGVSTERVRIGEVFEAAASLLGQAIAESVARGRYPRIRIDETTRALLDVRFEVAEREGRLVLRAERDIGGEARMLLGKPSPFVGRERQLRQLVDLVEESFVEGQASVVLVTGPAGIGKSRLRCEFVQTIQSMRPGLSAWMGRADSISAGSAFAMLSAALRRAFGISAGEPRDDQRRKLCAIVEGLIAPPEQGRVSAFLGELASVPLPDEHDPRLRAARQDASIMASRVEEAFVDFLGAWASKAPVLLVLEDLHWGDLPSVKLIDAALRRLREKPFVVMAFARSEVSRVFPGIWQERGLQEIRLFPLSRSSAETLSRSMLGDAYGDSVISTIVDRAQGNAFYLEELIRAVVEGRGQALPQSVLGMVEARLAALSPAERRALRAASVFGDVFWERGVSALLGEQNAAATAETLQALCQGEVVHSQSESRFGGQAELAFRHSLMREGAYATLTERDRSLGHRIAGEWLLKVGERDPMVLATHFDRGEVGARAAEFYLRAVEQAMRAGDIRGAIARSERGLACGPSAEVAYALHTSLGVALFFNADYPKSYQHAMVSVDGHEDRDGVAIATAVSAALWGGQSFDPALLSRLMKIEPSRSNDNAVAQALYMAFGALMSLGNQSDALEVRRKLDALSAADPEDLFVAVLRDYAWMMWLRDGEQDPWRSYERARGLVAGVEAAGVRQYLHMSQIQTGWSCALVGLVDEAGAIFDRMLANKEASNRANRYATFYKTHLLLQADKPLEASVLAERLRESAAAAGDHAMHANARFLVIECLLLTGRLDEAERELADFHNPSTMTPHLHAAVRLSLLAELRRRKGCLEEAAALAAEAISRGKPGPRFHYAEVPLLLRYAEILHEMGDESSARRVLAEARDDVLSRAEKIPEPDVRRSFLENIPQNRRTLELAREWLSGVERIHESFKGA